MNKINLDKVDLWIKKEKVKELTKLGFKKTTEMSIAGTPFNCYRYDLDDPTYILITENGWFDICSNLAYEDGYENCDDDDVFGIAKIVYELTTLGFLENRIKGE